MPKTRIKDLENSSAPYSIVATNSGNNPYYLSLNHTTLVVPVIHPNWKIYTYDMTTPWVGFGTSNNKNIIVEDGCQVVPNGYFTYPAASTGQGLPTAVSGSWGVALPAPNVASSSLYTLDTFTASNQTYTVSLTKPKSGLVVENSQVIIATGNDTTSDSMSVTFLPASYFGPSPETELTGVQIKQLGNKSLEADRVRTIVNFSSENNYTYYCYPAEYGNLDSITQNGVLEILGAFEQLDNVEVINDAGVIVDMIVYKSNALNAFTNATISFL